MSQEFQREDRYIVIKRSDLRALGGKTPDGRSEAELALQTHLNYWKISTRASIVVESDWPEYEPVWAMIQARMTGAPVSPAGGDVEVLGYCIYWPDESELGRYYGEQPNDGARNIELVDSAHVTRLQAENAALQQRLNVADQRVDELESALKFYADKEHFHFDEPEKWDSVSGEAENLLWHEEDPAYIEDGSVARNALRVAP